MLANGNARKASGLDLAVAQRAALAGRCARPTALALLEVRGAAPRVEAARAELRETDMLTPLPGGRFALLLPETDAADALICALRVGEHLTATDAGATVRIGATMLEPGDGGAASPLARALAELRMAGPGALRAELAGEARQRLADPRDGLRARIGAS